MKLLILVVAILVGACGGPSHYERVTSKYTRKGEMRQRYQEALTVAVTLKTLEWRQAFAQKTAKDRGLEGAALQQHLAQAQADDAGPLEFQLVVVTWDRRVVYARLRPRT